MKTDRQDKEKGPGAARPRRDGLPGSSPLPAPGPRPARPVALPRGLQKVFYSKREGTPPKRRVSKLPARYGLYKPHIYYHPEMKKWICMNYYALHRATSPVYAWRGFVRTCIAKHAGFGGFSNDK